MIRISRAAAPIAVLALAGTFAAPASAQYSNEYYPPKLVHQAKTGKMIAGTGQVIVQVQVNANGSHQVIKIIKSTNSGDNAAALDIAQRSSYSPATRGKKTVTAYYDFTLKFTGKSVVTRGNSAGAGGGTSFKGVAGQIDRLIRSANYAGAKAKAESALQSSPDDPILNSELGAADYFLNNLTDAAAAFAKVSNLNPEFKQVAANSYMQASTKLAGNNPPLSLAYAQRAVALSPGGGSYYALGSAELATGNAAQAAIDLKRSRDIVFADPKADVKSRVNVDAQLYAAYQKAGDAAHATATMDEINRLDPHNGAVSTLQANNLIAQGQALQKAGKYDDAIAAFEQAAAINNPDAQVTGHLSAAFALSSKLSQKDAKPTSADYKTMQGYAEKALAIRPDEPQGNYADGIALAGQYILGGKTDAGLKAKALAALNKAKAEAQSAGNMTLSIAVDNFVKQQLP